MLKKNRFLLISIFAHAILIFFVARSAMFSSKSTPIPDKQSRPIQARIIFDVIPAPPVEIQPVETSLPELVEAAPIEIEQPIEAEPTVIQEMIETEVPPATIPQPIINTPAPPEAQVETETPSQPDEPAPSTQSTIEIAPTNVPATTIDSSISNMARRHLGSFHQQQQQRMAEQASRDYQASKNSPFINTENRDSFMTEDEKLRESLKVRADCAGATKKTAAMVLGFLGGNIECTKPPPINGFIQNRLNKTTGSPRLSTQQTSQANQKKSIVIQDQ